MTIFATRQFYFLDLILLPGFFKYEIRAREQKSGKILENRIALSRTRVTWGPRADTLLNRADIWKIERQKPAIARHKAAPQTHASC